VIQQVLKYLGDLKLSALQWLYATVAAAFGVMLLVIRSQKAAIHKLEVQLIVQKLGTAEDQDSATVKALEDSLQEKLKAYQDAGGKL
jgi:hypothetical protein